SQLRGCRAHRRSVLEWALAGGRYCPLPGQGAGEESRRAGRRRAGLVAASSGAGSILSYVLPANALRLAALVAAAMTSGYLWRGAIEVRKPAKTVGSGPQAIGFELPDAPFSSLSKLRAHASRASAPVGKRRAVVRATPRRSIPVSRPGGAQLIAAVEAPPPSSVHAVRSKHSSRVRTAKPQPPSKSPRPKPPPPPVPPPPPPPANPPEPPPPPPPPAGAETRPGRGKGDRKHTHTGPPGQRKKKQKGEQGD